jgi:hypothetical protein
VEGYRIRFDGGQYKSTVGLDLVDMPTNNGRILRRFLLFLCLEKDPKMAKNRPMMLIRAMTTAQETRLLQARQILKLTWKTIAMILLTRHFRPKQETGQRSSKELCQYRRCKVQCTFHSQDQEYVELSRWVFSQRCECRRKVRDKDSSLTPQRVKALEGIGFVWSLSRPCWEDRFCELADYRKSHGTAMILLDAAKILS